MGRRAAALVLMVWLTAVLAGPPAALAAGSGTPLPPAQGLASPLTPLTPQLGSPPQTATTPPTTAPTSTSAGGLSGTDAVAIGIGALLVLGGISFFIWRDARKRAPIRQRTAPAVASGPGARARQKGRKLSPAERRRRRRGRAR